MLFQFGALFTDMSSFENVAFQMREHTDLPETLIRDLALMKLQAVGLRGAADLMPSELSGGWRGAWPRPLHRSRSDAHAVRRAVHGAGSDLPRVIAQLIRRLNDSLGATSIVVTHDVAEALELVDYVYYMSDGKVEFQGTPTKCVREAWRRSGSSSTVSPMGPCPSITLRRNTGRTCSRND